MALAPGMGMNAVFAQTIVVKMGAVPERLVIVFVSGAAFLILALTRIEIQDHAGLPGPGVETVCKAVLGLFIAYLGLLNGGLVVNSAGGPQFGSLHDHAVILVDGRHAGNPDAPGRPKVPAALLLSADRRDVRCRGCFVSHADGRPDGGVAGALSRPAAAYRMRCS